MYNESAAVYKISEAYNSKGRLFGLEYPQDCISYLTYARTKPVINFTPSSAAADF
jgi:hypothetical protein